MHIFPYSRRSGTPAAGMPGQVPNAVKEERARRARQTADVLTEKWLARGVGQVRPVLFEEKRDGLWRGHAPDYTEVLVPWDGDLHNRIRPVRLTGAAGGAWTGVLAPPEG